MAKEIERKFLVDKAVWLEHYALHGENMFTEQLTQAYLAKSQNSTIRVRISSEECAWLTIKSKAKGFTRDEFEYDVPMKEAKKLLKLCGNPVRKTRHIFPVKDHVWSVDVFKGVNKGLVLAEIELETEREKFSMPEWVGREVTYDKRYTNAYISDHKVPKK